MTQPNGEHIALDETGAQQNYTHAQGELQTHRDAIPDHDASGIDDPTISAALREHLDKTKSNINDAHDSLDRGKDAAKGLGDTDRDSAARTDRTGDLGGATALQNAMNRPTGPASPFAASPAPAAPMPSMPTPAAPPMPTMPAGPMVNLAPDALSKLMAGAHLGQGDGATLAAARAPGGRAGGRQPLRDSDIAFQRTGITLDKREVAALIERALDNNGISNDPAVRSEWRTLLHNQFQQESSFAPDAINRKDTNAHLGGPERSDGGPPQASRGIGQVIPGTFAQYHVAGTSNNIYDPEANMSAAVAYMMGRYHVSADGTGLAEFHGRRKSVGYSGY